MLLQKKINKIFCMSNIRNNKKLTNVKHFSKIRVKEKSQNILKLKNIFLKLGVSHLLVLSLTISIFSLVYLSSINIITTNIQQLQIMTLSQYRIFIDTQLLGIMQLSRELSYNRDVKNICQQDGISPGNLAIKRYFVYTNLKLMNLTNNLIENIGLYDMDTNTIVSGQGSYKVEDWCELEAKINIEEFKNKILQFKENSPSGFVLLQNIKSNSKPKGKYLAYVNIISRKSNSTKDVASIIILKSSFMSNPNINKDSNIFITDKNKNIIFSENSDQSKKIMENVDLGNILNNKNFQNYRNQGVIIDKSDIKDLLYISSVDIPEYGKQINLMRNLFIFCTIVSILLAVLIAFTVSSRKLTKINKIFSILGINNPMYKDEYECIKHAVTNIVEEKTHMQNYINQQTNTIFTYKLEDLIQGKLDDDNTFTIINSIDERFEEKSFITLLMSFLYDEPDEQHSTLIHSFYHNDENFEKRISINIVEENIKEAFALDQSSDCKIIISEVEGMIACIISQDNIVQFSQDDMLNIRKKINRIDDENRKEYGVRTFTGVSSVHKGIQKLSQAYNEAINALEYIQILGLKRVVFSNELNELSDHAEFSENGDTYLDGAEEHFAICIKMREYKKAQLIINETFNQYLNDNSLPSIHLLQCKLMGFMNIFLNSIKSKTFEYEELNKTRAFSRVLKCKTIAHMKMELINILAYADDLYSGSFIAATSNVGESILIYIKDHYSDPNLNVNALSELFNINISLLSRIIKNKTGSGPLEILQRLRLEKAKSLLVNTSSLNKVAEEVGLLNDAALIRLFKKYEKTTPGKYKDIIFSEKNLN